MNRPQKAETDSRKAPTEDRVGPILERLAAAYPDAGIALNFATPFELVVATVLSAQSTDVKVNEVTADLFTKYRSPEDYLAAPEDDLKDDLRPTGFYNQKTKSVRGLSQKLLEDFDGEVPQTIAELITLPGVARKTANIVQGNCFPDAFMKDQDAGIAVDTHVGRVAVRLGLTEHNSKDAVKIEPDLMTLIPKDRWYKTTYLFIEHGRRICEAKKPLCEQCPIESLCPSSQEAGLPDLYRVKAKPRRKAAGSRTKASS